MSNFANPQEPTYILQAILASATSALPAIVFANDLTKGLYRDNNGIHLSGLTATPSDSTEAASKAYVDAQVGGVTFPLLAPNGSVSAPSFSFSTEGTSGMWLNGPGSLEFSVGGSLILDLEPGLSAINASLAINPSGTNTAPSLELGEESNGFYLPDANSIGVLTGGGSPIEVARFDDSSVAHDTRLLLWDVDTSTLVRVSVGAVDSGGTGFKVLRIPN